MISHKNSRFFKILEKNIAKIEGIKVKAEEVDHDHCVKVHDKLQGQEDVKRKYDLHGEEVEPSNVIFNDHLDF